jgi:hypothetical protein
MRRIALVGLFIVGGAVSAHADMTVYLNTLKHPRSETELHADNRYCDERVGPDRNGVPTSAAYKRCMLSRGWRYKSTKYTKRERTWIDPDTGLTCHAILGGLGSACSNF